MRGYVKRLSQKASKLSKEQVLKLLDDILAENESLYSIMESLSTGMLIVDNSFLLLQNNLIIESQLPFSVHLDEPKVSQIPVWELINDDEISIYLKRCSENGITNSTEDFTTVTSGGSVRFLSLTISPLLQKGKLAGRILVVNDITENKNQQVLMNRMENMANLTNLAAGMAHEIKNPLGAISIHIQLIQKALKKARENQDVLPDKKFVENHIDVVNEEIEHLNKMITEFLLAVRPVKAVLELKDPSKLIENITTFFEPEFKKYNITVKVNLDASGKKILLDEKLFRDVILNLAQNSLAAIKSKDSSDDVSGCFMITSKIIDNRYVISVADNGCGMSPETVAKVFEPYFTTKANGTGLGMTMVYKIIKEFSGEITVNSQEGEGTEFVLQFPLHQKNRKLLASKEI